MLFFIVQYMLETIKDKTRRNLVNYKLVEKAPTVQSSN